MKKLINIFGIYGVLGLLAGVFGREFPKFFHFKGYSALNVVHTHLLTLGALLFAILILFALNTNILSNKHFLKFNRLYNIALPMVVLMLLVRGITQVMELSLSKSLNASISGITGISHILLTVAFVYLFLAIKTSVLEKVQEKEA